MGLKNAPYDMRQLDQYFQNKEFEQSGLVYRLPEVNTLYFVF
jgi:hypothetical protein